MKKIAGIVITFLFVLSLASCSGVSQDKFVGKYELSKAEGVGISLTQEQIDFVYNGTKAPVLGDGE